MSELRYKKVDDGHDGHDDHHDPADSDHSQHDHDDRELVRYVHDMLRSLEAITAGRALAELTRRIGAAKDAAQVFLQND